MSIDIRKVIKEINDSWTITIKLINNKGVVFGRISYDKVEQSGLFLIFKDKDNNITGTIRLGAIDKYDSNDNSIKIK